MQTILDYCIYNKDQLINYNQQKFRWKSQYNEEILKSILAFRDIYEDIPELIGRDDIVKSIKEEKYYLAFAEILLWGQIGSRPGSNVSKKTEIAHKALSYSKSKIETIFKTIIQSGMDALDPLYTSLERGGENKIDEVDVSYFTKILSFASEASECEFKLLIYDKWTRLIHVHLMLDAERGESARLYYSNNSLKNLFSISPGARRPSTKLIHARTNKGLDVYKDYCKEMDCIANSLSNKLNLATPISAFHLESFLFGKELRTSSNRNDSNPRFWVQNNFSTRYLPYLPAI